MLRSARIPLLAAAGALFFHIAVFGPSLVPGRIFAPLHSQRLEPWWSDLDREDRDRLRQGEYPSASDKLVSFRADDRVTLDAFERGRVPSWNPWNACGVPHLAQALLGVFYPPHLAYAVAPPERLWGWLALFHHLAASLGTFFLLRRLGLAASAALFGGIAFGGSTFLLARAHYAVYANNYAWLPWGVWLTDRLIDGERRSGLFLALLAGSMLLAGWPQAAVYVLWTWAAYALWRLGPELFARPARAAGASLLVLAAAGGALWMLDTERDLFVLAFWPHAALVAAAFAGRLRLPALRPLLPLCGAILLGTALAAIQILPPLEWSEWGARSALGAPEALAANGLRPRFLLGFLAPHLFGTPGSPFLEDTWNLTRLFALRARDVADGSASLRGNLLENACAVGFLPLLLLPAALNRRRRGAWFFVAIGALALFFALGARPVVYPLWFSGWFVGVDPRRVLGLVAFSAAALGAFGLDRLLATSPGRLRLRAAALLAAGALALLFLSRAPDAALCAPLVAHARSLAEALSVQADPPGEAVTAAAGLVRSALARLGLLALASSFLLVMLGRRGAPGRAAAVGALVLIGVDLVHAAYPFVRPQPSEGFLESHPLVERARTLTTPLHRIAHYSEIGPYLTAVALPPNTSGLFGIRDAWCYTVSPPRRVFALAERLFEPSRRPLAGVAIPPIDRPEALASRVLDLFAVRAVFGYGPLPDPLPSGLRLDRVSGRSWLAVNEDALPRVFWVGASEPAPWPPAAAVDRLLAPDFDPRATVLLEGAERTDARPEPANPTAPLPLVRLVADEGDRLSLAVEGADRPGFLVVLDTWAPGWKARVDGKPAPVLRADVAFRAVPLPPGARTVELRYRPASIRAGGAVSLAALALLFVGLLSGRRSRRGAAAAPGASPPS